MLMGSIYFGTITKDIGGQNSEEKKKEANKKKELLVKAILRQEQIF